MKKNLLLTISALAITTTFAMPVSAQTVAYQSNNSQVVDLSNCTQEDIQAQLNALGINDLSCNNYVLDCSLPNISLSSTDCNEITPELPDGSDETPSTDSDSDNTDNNIDKSFAMQVIDLVNEERAKAGLSAVVLDKSIASAALVRAKETEISFSHTRPNGSSYSTALTEAGVTYRGSGENIAWGQKTPADVMNGWMNSEGHKANILNSNFTKIGVGYYQNSNGTNYWTQLFTY